jgi:CSLREA domain-containing protein
MNHRTSSHRTIQCLLALCLVSIFLGLILFFPTPPGAHAASLTVNTLSDAIVADEYCSLREAITNANNNNTSGATECTAGTAGLDTITITATGTITLTSALPTITDTLAIDGPGAALLTISGNNSYNVMVVGVFTSKSVEPHHCERQGWRLWWWHLPHRTRREHHQHHLLQQQRSTAAASTSAAAP